MTAGPLPRRALVTGASSGIGAAVADTLATRGLVVYAAARRIEALSALRAGASGEIIPVALDIVDPESRRRAVEEVTAEHGLDILINNAGMTYVGAAETADIGNVRRVFETNFFGPLELTRQLLPEIRASATGRIVFISAIGALRNTPLLSAYGASKAAADALAMCMDLELRRFGVRACCVIPGLVRTTILDNAPPPPESDLYRQETDEYRAALVSRMEQSSDLTPVVEAVIAAAVRDDPPPRTMVANPDLAVVMAPIVSALGHLHLADATAVDAQRVQSA
jgi:NAD(P)-dependent dehydrogenase (short-subunit alcohol dehydrogenase family)